MMYQGRGIQIGDSVKSRYSLDAKGMVTNIEGTKIQIYWTFLESPPLSFSYTEKEIYRSTFTISPSIPLEQQILDLLG
jgi:hypothetical protein